MTSSGVAVRNTVGTRSWCHRPADRLAGLLRKFPAVALLGARQVGKTTLVRHACAHLPYCDLEEPRTRALFAEDPAYQIAARERGGLVLDEVRSVPAVLGALRGVIDADRSALQQQLVAVSLDGERARSIVNLIRAIGGGWSLPPAPETAQAQAVKLAEKSQP